MRSRLFAAALLVACAHAPRPRPHAPTGPVTVFTEPYAVTQIAPAANGVLVGTAGGLALVKPDGSATRVIPGDVKLLAPEPAGTRFWVYVDGKVVRYDPTTGEVTPLPRPPEEEEKATTELIAIAGDRKGGVWLAGPEGLVHADLDGSFEPAGVTGAITALASTDDGRLFIATKAGLSIREESNGVAMSRRVTGLDLEDIVALTETPDGRPIAVGKDRIAIETDAGWIERPAVVSMAAHVARETLLVAGGRFVTLAPKSSRVGAKTDALGAEPLPYDVGELTIAAPEDTTALGLAGGDVLLGTRSRGVERVNQSTGALSWVRPHLLTPDNGLPLFVACHGADACWLATGGEAAWRFDGKFVDAAPVPGESIVFAVVRSTDDEIFAIGRAPDEKGLHLARLGKDGFAAVPGVELRTPEPPSVPFARFGPDGLLWIGLQLGQGDDATPFGAATIDLAVDTITYHRDAAKAKDSLKIPADAVDVAFNGGETWFATLSGAAQVRGDGEVKLWSEANGLVSEILHGVATDAQGNVFIASTSGVGVFDGKGWTYPQALALPALAMARDREGRLWLGTDQGLVWWDGEKVTPQPGLLGGEVDALAADAFGRIWARQASGIVLVAP